MTRLRWYKSAPERLAQWLLCPVGRGPDDDGHDADRDVRAVLQPEQSASSRAQRADTWSAWVGGRTVARHVSFREAKAAADAAAAAKAE